MSLMQIILAASLLLAMIFDILYQRIPNWLTFSTFIVGVVHHIYFQGLPGVLFSIEGAAVGVGTLIIPYLLGGTGAGDAKLMGAVGALLGPKGVFVAFLLTALIGGVYAAGVLAWQGFLGATVRRFLGILRTLLLTGKFMYVPPPEKEKSPRLRYGVAIALGTLLSVLMHDKIFAILNLT